MNHILWSQIAFLIFLRGGIPEFGIARICDTFASSPSDACLKRKVFLKFVAGVHKKRNRGLVSRRVRPSQHDRTPTNFIT